MGKINDQRTRSVIWPVLRYKRGPTISETSDMTTDEIFGFLQMLCNYAVQACLKQTLLFVQFSRHTSPTEIELLLPYLHYALTCGMDTRKQANVVLQWVRKCMNTPRLLQKDDPDRLDFSVQGSVLHFLTHPCTTEWLYRVVSEVHNFTLNNRKDTPLDLYADEYLDRWNWSLNRVRKSKLMPEEIRSGGNKEIWNYFRDVFSELGPGLDECEEWYNQQ